MQQPRNSVTVSTTRALRPNYRRETIPPCMPLNIGHSYQNFFLNSDWPDLSGDRRASRSKARDSRKNSGPANHRKLAVRPATQGLALISVPSAAGHCIQKYHGACPVVPVPHDVATAEVGPSSVTSRVHKNEILPTYLRTYVPTYFMPIYREQEFGSGSAGGCETDWCDTRLQKTRPEGSAEHPLRHLAVGTSVQRTSWESAGTIGWVVNDPQRPQGLRTAV
ncbi:hypothetical protein B0H17DRAFT_1143027 [Mycena rosella]|uniref:Uncharacterized protein n=1 Tax=Mycena rosella TaxID=1033263 RepID=A0AAD7CWI5_MYCRO|nr:hypothetical protein B0H17DRAFT_1143027 [Mycena rosella]